MKPTVYVAITPVVGVLGETARALTCRAAAPVMLYVPLVAATVSPEVATVSVGVPVPGLVTPVMTTLVLPIATPTGVTMVTVVFNPLRAGSAVTTDAGAVPTV